MASKRPASGKDACSPGRLLERWRRRAENITDPKNWAPKYLFEEFRRIAELPEPQWEKEERTRDGPTSSKRARVTCKFSVGSDWEPSFAEAEAKAAYEWLLLAYQRYGASERDFCELKDLVRAHNEARAAGKFRDGKTSAKCPTCPKDIQVVDFEAHYKSCLEKEIDRRVAAARAETKQTVDEIKRQAERDVREERERHRRVVTILQEQTEQMKQELERLRCQLKDAQEVRIEVDLGD